MPSRRRRSRRKYRTKRRSFRKRRTRRTRRSRRYLTIWRKTNANTNITMPGPGLNTNNVNVIPVNNSYIDSVSFCAIYSEYKILKAVVRWKSLAYNTTHNGTTINSTTHNPNPGWMAPNLLAYVDGDGTFGASTPQQYLMEKTFREWVIGEKKVMSYSFTPKFLYPAYKNTISFNYLGKTGWLSTDSPAIPHYGMQYMVTNSTSMYDWSGVNLFQELWIKVAYRKPMTGKLQRCATFLPI